MNARVYTHSIIVIVFHICREVSEKGGVMHTFCLNAARSFGVKVSALAMTGIKLTREPKRFITSISNGFRLCHLLIITVTEQSISRKKKQKKLLSFGGKD